MATIPPAARADIVKVASFIVKVADTLD